MTVEIEYDLPRPHPASDWQEAMAEQIEQNRGFPTGSIERELDGTALVVRVETSLPSDAVSNMLSDIEDHIPPASQHVETRDIEQ